MALITSMKNSFLIVIFGILGGHLIANDNFFEAIIQVGPKGSGNEKLVKSWPLVKKMSSSDIPHLLKVMNQANELGDNRARAAIYEILENAGKQSLPKDETIAFIKDQSNQGSSRRAAFDFLNSISPQVAQSLLSTFIDDPEPSLRREGVALLLTQAENLEKKEQAMEAYEYALSKARDVDQIETACKSLEELGKEINITERMGFLTEWQVIGPFDNFFQKWIQQSLFPEHGTNLLKSHTGKDGPVQWQTFSTSDRLGLVDLNQPFGHIKEVLCYAYSEFGSYTDPKGTLSHRIPKCRKLWVNQS